MSSLALKAVGAAAVATSTFGLLAGGSASAATIDGSATPVMTNNAGTTQVLTGLSDTAFGVKLSPSAKQANGAPDGKFADCAADTATGSTNVRTFLIHASDTVTTEDFGQNEPGVVKSGNMTLALFDTDGNIQTDGNTGNTGAGTGQIIQPPTQAFSFGQIVSDNGGSVPLSTLLYSGNTGAWKGGYACFKAGNPGVVTDYWQFSVTYTALPVSPGNAEGFSWTVVPDGTATTPPAALPELGLPIILPLGGVGLIAGAVAVGRRRRNRGASI